MQTDSQGVGLRRVQSAFHWMVGSPLCAFIIILILAFGVRAYSVRNIPVINLLPNPDRELGAIATSLVETGRFADPYMIPTGPTAHLPPIPPAILAFIYYWFGHTNLAGYIFMGFTMVTSAVMYALLPWIADKLGVGKRAGFIGGLLGAFMVELEWPTHGEGLAAILLGLMLVAFLRRWSKGKQPLRVAFVLGVGIGISFHVQPALLPVFLGCLAFEIMSYQAKRKFAITGMLALGVVLACVPWAWRNYTAFHDFFFIRDNLGLELRMGNHEGAAATIQMMDAQGQTLQHPRLILAEASKLKELGEIEYMRQALTDALTWIRETPLEFLRLSFMRLIHFWLGPFLHLRDGLIAAISLLAILGARRVFPVLSLPQKWLMIIPLVTYPLIYYLVPYMPRYRVPIDWILILLAGAEISGWVNSMVPGLGKRYSSICAIISGKLAHPPRR